ncbi:hypothetical protein SLS55_006522 [Diplodia seriata]|uniref:Uncharacterized protein n=1 Tax=Diplodia seriata TaxID=420778 RepID=A0ABR3CEG7_9PEZI
MTSYPPSHGFSDSSVRSPSGPNSSQQSVSAHSVTTPMASHPQIDYADYHTASAPVLRTPAMGFPTLSYNENQIQAARLEAQSRYGIHVQAATQQQHALKAQYQQQLEQQREDEQRQYHKQHQSQLYQRRKQREQLQCEQLQREQLQRSQQFLTVPGQQRHRQQQQFPPATVAEQQQNLQLQTPVMSPNQANSPINQQQNNGYQNFHQQEPPQTLQQHNIQQRGLQQNLQQQSIQRHNTVQQHNLHQPGIQPQNIHQPNPQQLPTIHQHNHRTINQSPAPATAPTSAATPTATATATATPFPTAAPTAPPQPLSNNNNTNILNINPTLPPLPPLLIEPHPLSKSIDNLILLHHPLVPRAVDRLSMTTASSLLRLCADFEYRDLSADCAVALTPATRAWLAAHLRELNAARRESARRLYERWQRCVQERAARCYNVRTGEVDWVQQEEVEVPGGTERELRMLDWEAREAMGRIEIPQDGRIVVFPLIRPGWELLQLRQVRGPSAKEWEDFVVDDVGELRRQKENREKEEREQREREEEALAGGQGDDDDEVTIVGSRVLSEDEMRAVAAQRSAKPAKQPPAKNIAAASAKPKKVSLKAMAQKKTHGRKKSATAKAKGGMPKPSVSAEANNVASNVNQSNTAPAQSAPQISDYPPIHSEAPQNTNQNISVAAPTIDLTTTVRSPPAAQVSEYGPIYATDTATSGVPNYGPIYGTSTAASGASDYPPIHDTNTSAAQVSDYGPIYATGSTAEASTTSPSIQPNTTATVSNIPPPTGTIDFSEIDRFLGLGMGGLPGNAATDTSSQVSSALQNQPSELGSHNDGDVAAGQMMAQMDGVFEPNFGEDDHELDDLFEGEIDE